MLQVSTAPGTSLPEMLRIGQNISEALLRHKNIATVEQQAGRAEQGEDPWGPHRCEFHVDLKPLSGEEAETMAGEIRKILARFPGIQSGVLTFLGDRIGETITGETAPVVISLFGDDLEVLDAKAREVVKVLQKVRGAADVSVKSPPGAPCLAIRLRPFQGNRVSEVTVILEEPARRDLESVGDLQLRSAQGLRVPLRELAEIYRTSGRYAILHEGARRRQTITCNATGRDVTSFVADARRQLAEKVSFPGGVYPVFSGAAEAQAAAQRQLLLHSMVAAVGILLLLVVVFGGWRNLFLVLVNVPFALVGGVLAVYLSGLCGPAEEAGLTIGSLVGFVTLFGITMRNSIMLIAHFEHLVQEEGLSWGPEAAMRGASERLGPILMTAIVTGLGLLPLALGSGEAGREIEGPMAIVILGGLVTSTLLNLLVLPTLALRYGRFEKSALTSVT